MNVLYLECNMGAAGDMLLAALLELLPDRDGFLARLNGLGLPGVSVTAAPKTSCGITGTHVTVTVHGHEEHGHCHGHHHHSTLSEIFHIIDHLPVSDWVKTHAKGVYDRIAKAESQVHGVTVEEIHFHEVGAWDAVTDVVSVTMALEALSPDRIVCSPVHVGSGQVKCAHGILPVPAPATALLLKDVPVYAGDIKGELCTPTGAALLTEFADEFASMPAMTLKAVGCGIGTKEFEAANCVRAFWGTAAEHSQTIAELSCNLDDMTGEAIGFAMEVLLDNGAVDVFTTPIGMKKSRPGVMLTVLCRETDADRMAQLMLEHTTTLGVRRHDCSRYTLSRTFTTVQTPYGEIRVKVSGSKRKPEYEDAAKAAREHGVTLNEVLRAAFSQKP